MKRAIAFAAAALALPLAVAVHAEEDEAPLTAQWVAIELDGKAVDGPTLAYTTDRVSGTGGCNRFNGPIAIEDDAVQIGPLVSTRMFCEGKSELESRYLAALEEARAFTIENGKLVLKGENGKVLLKFRK